MKIVLTELEQQFRDKLFADAAELKRELKMKHGFATAQVRARLRGCTAHLFEMLEKQNPDMTKKDIRVYLVKLGILDQNHLPVPEFGGEPSNPKPKKKRK